MVIKINACEMLKMALLRDIIYNTEATKTDFLTGPSSNACSLQTLDMPPLSSSLYDPGRKSVSAARRISQGLALYEAFASKTTFAESYLAKKLQIR